MSKKTIQSAHGSMRQFKRRLLRKSLPRCIIVRSIYTGIMEGVFVPDKRKVKKYSKIMKPWLVKNQSPESLLPWGNKVEVQITPKFAHVSHDDIPINQLSFNIAPMGRLTTLLSI